MNDEEDQLDGYEYDVGRTKKSSNYNATDAYLQELMSNCIDEWCCNFNIHHGCWENGWEKGKDMFYVLQVVKSDYKNDAHVWDLKIHLIMDEFW